MPKAAGAAVVRLRLMPPMSFSGWRCSERRPASGRNKVEYNAKVTCKKGSRVVVYTYQQNI